MPCQLPADCLNEIFEYLEQDKVTLHSCLLVNHLWCEISVRILWRDIWDFKDIEYVSLRVINTLVACLPDESRDLLHQNGISLVAQTQKSLLFNYATFYKVLSINGLDQMVLRALESQQPIISSSKSLCYSKYLILQELLKLFMKQIHSLKVLKYNSGERLTNVTFTHFPGTINCLRDLTELSCSSDAYPEFFCQLSQICCKIQ